MILGNHSQKINSTKVKASDDVLLLGITIDKKLIFKQILKHIEHSFMHLDV